MDPKIEEKSDFLEGSGPPPPLALITGAGGFLGGALATRLLSRGWEVRCLLRRPEGREGLSARGARVFLGDVTQPASLANAVDGAAYVFHLAGVRRSPRRRDFFEVNAEGTRNVCEAMVRSGGRPRLVLVSSLAAAGPSPSGRPLTEEDPLCPVEWYGESKAEAERIAFSYRDRLEVTAARPARILGPGDRENRVFFRLVSRGVKLSVGGGPRPISFVDVEDTVDALLLLAERPEARGEAFFVASPERLTLEEVEERIERCLSKKARWVRLSPWLLWAMATLADGASLALPRPLPLNRKLARQLLAPGWACRIDKAERLLGFRPTISIDDSIRRSASWYQQNRWI